MQSNPQMHAPVPTGGALFNRKDPRNAAGEVQPILDRALGVREGRSNSIFNQGKDFTGLADRSRFKYRIPDTSVVNKVGDCRLFCCCGWRLTAAQWVWLLNFVCFCAHTTMVFVVAYFAWWSKDLSVYGDDSPYHVKIYRVSAQWNNATVQGYDYLVEDNQMPIDIAWATLAFFLISAVFHLFAVVAGLFESMWFRYWRQVRPLSQRALLSPPLARPRTGARAHRAHAPSPCSSQMDDAFCYWRWIEYSGSASLMGILLAVVLGIREQNTVRCFLQIPGPQLRLVCRI